MTERLDAYKELENMDEKNLILAFVEHNIRVAGETNKFQPFWKFKHRATPIDPKTHEPNPLQPLFEWETPNGRIWHIQKTLPGLKQFVMRTTNKGTHVDIWGPNVMVRLAHFLEEDEEED